MARIEPKLSLLNTQHSGELDTLEWFQDALPDDYTVFHSVEWLKRKNQDTLGEVDFCIVGPSGKIVLIEQKNGGLTVNENGALIKKYASSEKEPYKQISRSRNQLISLWCQRDKPSKLECHLIVYLPDYHVKNRDKLTFDEDCLVDASNKPDFPELLQSLVGCDNPDFKQQLQAQAVHDFFSNEFELEVDVGEAIEYQNQHYKRIETNYGQFIRQLEFSPYHLLVEGPAGSGKTQICAEVYQHKISEGLRPLYICHNRPLADTMRKSLSDLGKVFNIDRFFDSYLKEQNLIDESAFLTPDDRITLLKETLQETPQQAQPPHSIAKEWTFSALVIDEGQDITQEKFELLQHFLTPDSPIVVAKDQQQNLYHNGFSFTPTVKLDLDSNYRCTQEIIQFTDALLGLKSDTSDALSLGSHAKIQSYATQEEQNRLIEKRVSEYLEQGYELKNIVILYGKGREKSELSKLDTLGKYSLKQFTGEYTKDGENIYTEGELLVESIYRFKGLQKAVVIFAELEFERWTKHLERVIYTGCTRARLELSVLMSNDSEKILIKQISNKNKTD